MKARAPDSFVPVVSHQELMVELSKIDEDLLEFLALSEPWSMVCGEFSRRYQGVEKLVARLATFHHAEYIVITPEPGAPPPSCWSEAVCCWC